MLLIFLFRISRLLTAPLCSPLLSPPLILSVHNATKQQFFFFFSFLFYLFGNIVQVNRLKMSGLKAGPTAGPMKETPSAAKTQQSKRTTTVKKLKDEREARLKNDSSAAI